MVTSALVLDIDAAQRNVDLMASELRSDVAIVLAGGSQLAIEVQMDGITDTECGS